MSRTAASSVVLIRPSGIALAIVDACREVREEAQHHAAVRALAFTFKWIRILYRCWKDRTPYDEQRYLQALKRRGSRLLKRLPAQVALSAAQEEACENLDIDVSPRTA